MRAFVFVCALVCLVLLPVTAEAQVEVGIDAGLSLVVQEGIDNQTLLEIPSSSIRIGSTNEAMRFEALFGLRVLSSGGTLTAMTVIPGLAFPLGEAGGYIRPEVGFNLVSGGGDTETELLAGVGLGIRKPIADGPVSFRFEVGYDRWFDSEVNQFRATFGLSTVVGG